MSQTLSVAEAGEQVGSDGRERRFDTWEGPRGG